MTPEAKVKRKVTAILKRLQLYYFMPLTGGYGRSGVPDIIICAYGYFLAVECKAGGNKLTDLQRGQIAQIKNAGGYAFVVTDENVRSFEKFLTRFLEKLRE